jgi:hypothetical protein
LAAGASPPTFFLASFLAAVPLLQLDEAAVFLCLWCLRLGGCGSSDCVVAGGLAVGEDGAVCGPGSVARTASAGEQAHASRKTIKSILARFILGTPELPKQKDFDDSTPPKRERFVKVRLKSAGN